MTFDLPLTADSYPVLKGLVFGARGGLNENSQTLWPFILRPNGIIDYGSDWEDNEREAATNLLSGRAFIIDELFTISQDGDDVTYRVAKVLTL